MENRLCLGPQDLKTSRRQTEFEFLLEHAQEALSIKNLDYDEHQLPILLEQKISDAVDDVAKLILAQNQGKSAQAILQTVAAKIPSTVLVQYTRTGKNYVSIDHCMGQLGNMFFQVVFDNLVKDNLAQSHHTIIQDDKVSFVFRQ